MFFKIKNARLFVPLFLIFTFACQTDFQSSRNQTSDSPSSQTRENTRTAKIESAEIKRLLENAHEQTKLTKIYDPAYVVLPYPNGDVPIERGVCTDVVIRAFRNVGIDLQKEVHEDMKANFSVYPQKWGLPAPDKNIDHRRVPNLQTFFTRRGKSLPISKKAEDYQPGDIVSWDLDGKGLAHIGLVSDIYDESTKRYFIIHNISSGTRAEDRLFEWKITGHYRYF